MKGNMSRLLGTRLPEQRIYICIEVTCISFKTLSKYRLQLSTDSLDLKSYNG